MNLLPRLLAMLAWYAATVCAADDWSAREPGAALFTNRMVRHFQITIAPEHVAALRVSPRQYVPATLREGSNTFARVGIHLKGATGSFRSIDGKPAFTISFDRFDKDQRFHGLSKIHLNNSVEDPSYMHELIGGDMFRAVGVPASRVAHALVEFNGRRLGTFVLKEGFTEDFLAMYFRHTNGSLYDTGAGHDVDELLRKDMGANPDDRSDLEALSNAAFEPDLERRWLRLQGMLDMDRVISFMAMEILLGHRDGYCLARNNFRVYHDVDSGRLLFFPHGMDVLFGNARAMIEPRMNGLVARAILETPQGRRAYRHRLRTIFTNHFDVAAMHARINDTVTYLRPALPPEEQSALDREVAALKERISARRQELEKMLATPPLELLSFNEGMAVISGWLPVDVPEGGSLSESTNSDGKRALLIRAGPITSASWRAKVLLPPGRYRFEGALQTESVTALKFGKNHGATLRASSPGFVRSPATMGTQPWKRTQVSFETTAREQEVDLICELRASNGQAWFDLDSLRIVREP